jgi:hypothetical protein
MKLLKDISIFVVGAAIGVAGSYKFFETKFSKIADEEIESIKMMARNNIAKSQHQYDGRASGADVDGDVMTPEVEYKETPKELEEAHRTYNDISAAYKNRVAKEIGLGREPIQKVDYSAITRGESKVDDDEQDDEQEHGEIEMDRKNSMLSNKPIIITSQSYVEDCLDYDKLTFNYYAKDKVLTDDNDDVFEDYEDYVGHNIGEHFGESEAGDNLLYIRNYKYESDYEIIKLDEYYV